MDIDQNNIRRLDLTLLLIFRELVRHRRTTVVAERLGLSQSAVSHALGRLRAVFGEALFLRRPDGLEPTRRALDLAPRIETILRLTQEAVGASERFDPAATDRLFRLAGNDLVCALTAAPLLADLSRHAPHARVTIRFAVHKEALEALRGDDVDLALGRFHDLPDGFEAIPLFEESFVVIARAGHPALAGGMGLPAFLACEHILVSFQGGLSGPVDLALRARGLARRVVASVPVFLAAFAAVAESDLVATVPARLAARHAAAFGLKIHATPLPVDPFPVTAVRHVRSRGDGGLDWLAGRVAALFGTAPSGDAASPVGEKA